MKMTSFNDNLTFGDTKPVISVILETDFSKEIRIVLKQGQLMKEHKTPFPIVIHVLTGFIDFGVAGETHSIRGGGILTLEGNVPHDLTALEDSIIRLSLSKADNAERVEKVVDQLPE